MEEFPTRMMGRVAVKAIAAVGFVAVAFLFAPGLNPTAQLELGTDGARSEFAEGLVAYDAGDYETARNIWEDLADKGNIEALLALAQLYEDGLGIEPDLRRSRNLYRQAALAGDGLGALNYGDFLFRGLGGAKDPVQGYLWMKRAETLGRKWAAVRSLEIFESLSEEERKEALQKQKLAQ